MKKNGISIVISLGIFIFITSIVYQVYEYAKQVKIQVTMLNATIQREDGEIMQLIKIIKLKQAELSGVKAELDSIKKAISDAQNKINK